MPKIMILGNFESSWDGSICDELNIAHALQNQGWEVFPFQREDTQQTLEVAYSPDIILIAQWANYPRQLASKLRNIYNCPVIYWAFDYQWASQEQWHFELAQEVDLFLSKELGNKEKYEAMGCKFRWFCQDFGPDFLEPYNEPVDKIYDVVFTGSHLDFAPFRTELLMELDKEFDLHVFSVTHDAWNRLELKNVHYPMMDHELPKLYAQSKVVLACDSYMEPGYWSDRVGQALQCGATILNKYIEPQDKVFGDMIQNFDTVEECKEYLTYMLAHPPLHEAKEIASFGRDNFSVTARVKDFIALIKEEGLYEDSTV